jgi:hypothetical protein
MKTLILPAGVFLMITAGSLAVGCQAPAERPATETPSALAMLASDPAGRDEFGDYWYQGEAELTSYDLQQARYGEIHDGDAVLIFVTEDLSEARQVKLDDPSFAGKDKVGVLKLNMNRKFTTGIYPYSMMTSVFTPIQRGVHPQTLKVTTSSQEWCGHTFTQLNLRKGKYRLQFNSYFEKEGDQRLDLDDAMLEDEIWTLIRLDPDALPTGNVRIIPGTIYQRLSHEDWAIQQAVGSLAPFADQEDQMEFTLEYPALKRTLKVRFNAAFPHEIETWEETYASGFGPDARPLTTRATRKKRIMLDYWNHHGTADEALRQELALN